MTKVIVQDFETKAVIKVVTIDQAPNDIHSVPGYQTVHEFAIRGVKTLEVRADPAGADAESSGSGADSGSDQQSTPASAPSS